MCTLPVEYRRHLSNRIIILILDTTSLNEHVCVRMVGWVIVFITIFALYFDFRILYGRLILFSRKTVQDV